MLYVETSVVVRALMADEEGHERARDLLASHAAVTARWTRVEAVSAITRRHRAGRAAASDLNLMMAQIDRRFAALAVLDPGPVIYESAVQLILRYRLKPLDALHVAAAFDLCHRLASPGEPRSFASFDVDQAYAARDFYQLDWPS